MQNKLMMAIIIIFSSTAMIAIEYPDRTEIDTTPSVTLPSVEFSDSQTNAGLSHAINTTLDEDMKESKYKFYLQLQAISQEKAKETIKKCAAQGNFYQAALIVDMQDKICRNCVETQNFDYTNDILKTLHCTTENQILKEVLRNAMDIRHETLEIEMQATQYTLEEDIKKIMKYSKKNILNKQKEQQKLREIWFRLNNGKL